MKKKLTTPLCLTAISGLFMLLSACATSPNHQNITELKPRELKPRIGSPNPASKYCIDQGGKLSIKKQADGGESGLCTLPNGQVIDDWEFFRNSMNQ